MKKMLLFSILIVCFLGLTSEVVGNRDDLVKDAKTPEVAQELDQPDGVALKFLANGEWRMFARGTGVYDFNDEDDKQTAQQEATLKAKANISKFFKETLSTQESFDSIMKKMKQAQKNAQGESKNISLDQVKTFTNRIQVNSEAILNGVITLVRERIPASNGEGGTVRVTLGMSSKTLAFVKNIDKEKNKDQKQGENEGDVQVSDTDW